MHQQHSDCFLSLRAQKGQYFVYVKLNYSLNMLKELKQTKSIMVTIFNVSQFVKHFVNSMKYFPFSLVCGTHDKISEKKGGKSLLINTKLFKMGHEYDTISNLMRLCISFIMYGVSEHAQTPINKTHHQVEY